MAETEDIRPNIGVYVPRPDTIAWLTISPGSAMVVDPPPGATPDTIITCYFETRERHQGRRTPFATLVNIAGGRCRWRKTPDGQWASYPTQSKAPLRLGDLVRVGEFDDYLGEVLLEPGMERLAQEWLGRPVDLGWELRAEGRRYEEGRLGIDPFASPAEKERQMAILLSRRPDQVPQ